MNARTLSGISAFGISAFGITVAASLVVAGCGQKSAGGKHLVVGYSQIGAESGWRQANTDSIKAEAKKRGIELKFSDAQQKQENQIKALKSFVAQKVDVIMFSPVVESGWKPVMAEIKAAGIPVIVADRRPDVDESMYVTFIGSDFVEEGRRAGEWLAKKMNGKANIAELVGTVGSAPALDRAKGFREVLAKYPGMKIVISQSGDFTRTKGKEAMEAFLKSPQGRSANALFAHNDDMALGAIQAIEEAGLKPGKDIIIVSIDGVKDAFQAMVDGKLNCTVECNPLIGPQLFDAVEAVVAKKPLPKRIVVQEGVYDQTVAKSVIGSRQY
jgi:simple sugar transport system substrate-binding protein